MDRDLRVVLSARVFSDQKCFGPGVSQLLKRVDELHSLRAAAMSLSIADSKAWMVIRNAENGLGFHLLLSNTGGRNGGGAVLTDEARQNGGSILINEMEQALGVPVVPISAA